MSGRLIVITGQAVYNRRILSCASSSVTHGLFEDPTPYRPSAGTVPRAGIVKFVRVIRADDRYLA